jgi:hypothetical protein
MFTEGAAVVSLCLWQAATVSKLKRSKSVENLMFDILLIVMLQ